MLCVHITSVMHARLLTFAAQQSILQMHMQTIKVIYEGRMYAALIYIHLQSIYIQNDMCCPS